MKLWEKITLSSVGHEILPAHKWKNANNCWHFKIYKQEKIALSELTKKLNILIF